MRIGDRRQCPEAAEGGSNCAIIVQLTVEKRLEEDSGGCTVRYSGDGKA